MTDETNETGTDHRLSVSRRTVVKGAAWSVPAIVIASQAPAMAVGSPGIVEFSGIACKYPGNSNKEYPKSYKFEMVSTNTWDFDVVIVVTGFTLNGATATKQYLDIVVKAGSPCSSTTTCGNSSVMLDRQNNPAVLCVPADSVISWWAITGEFGDSAQSVAVISYTVYKASDCTVVESGTSQESLTTPPCDDVPPTTVTSVTPNTGPVAGGTTVTVTGTNFTDATAVNFGATPGTNFRVVSDTSITVRTPPGQGPGAVTVTVVNPATGGGSLANGFTYV